MLSDGIDFSAQRAFVAAKIAAATAAAAAEDSALALARREFGESFRRYFSTDALEPWANKKSATRRQLAMASRSFDNWWLFGRDEASVAIGFNNRLVVAAADFAICKSITPHAKAQPTAVDRSIAAALARRFCLVGAEAADNSQNGVPTLRTAGTDLEAAFTPADADRWRLLSFGGAFPGEGGEFAVMIAHADRSDEMNSAPEAVHLTAGTVARLSGLSVSAKCIGGRFEARLGRILDLKPGDVVPIRWQGNGAARLVLGGRLFATGTLGDNNGRRAIRL
jgi:hypothetical protein